MRHGTSHMSDHLMVPIDSIKQDRHTIIDVPTYFASRGPYCLNYNTLNNIHRRVQMIDFARSGQELRYQFCQICLEGFLDASWHMINNKRLCERCKREHTKGAVHKFSLANDMDPGIVPAWLPTLSMIERMCRISHACCIGISCWGWAMERRQESLHQFLPRLH